MRRVIVDQIEALAELNRIVARHGRNLDAVEPMRRPAREEPALAVIGGGRGERRRRGAVAARDAGSFAAAAAATRRLRAAAPAAPKRRALTPGQAGASSTAGSPICSTAPRATRTSARARAAREPARARPDERTPRHSIESLEFAVGRYRPHDRPRRRRRSVGPLQARRAQRVHPPALHPAGPEGVRRDPPASIAPTASSSRRSTATSASSSGCSTRSRATTAARWWRAPISPRKPARSTPCWRTRPAASTDPELRSDRQLRRLAGIAGA